MTISKNKPYYPIFLNLNDEPVLVVGAGAVAERKIRGLLNAGADVTVVAPLATAAVKRWSASGQLHWHAREYKAEDLRGQCMVFSATDHPEVDRRVAQGARRRGFAVNCAALPELGNFILPASARAGRVQIAVSTGGASPALARNLAVAIADTIRSEYLQWANLLNQLRPAVIRKVPQPRRAALWNQLAGEQIGRLLRQRKSVQARQLALQMIERARKNDRASK
ncbi:MAG: bifunctional precorrin-2 dehydrogenase/sirohydrochlorin ferrochelatase [Acidobacteria bacterium]|nr:bifunctional precorrin-2 dehydrogenase/sirohydrochlorin ferrochelatase [Acidobacteriota bacterium]